MVRTQIQLTEEQADLIKQVAADRRISMAELIRQSIDSFLQNCLNANRAERVERALAATGRFRSGTNDVSANHDTYLVEAFRQ